MRPHLHLLLWATALATAGAAGAAEAGPPQVAPPRSQVASAEAQAATPPVPGAVDPERAPTSAGQDPATEEPATASADADGPAASGDAAGEPAAEAPPARPPPWELVLRSAAGTRGDAGLDALARARLGRLVLTLGAGSATGPQAAERRSLLAGLDWEGGPLAAAALLRLLPVQAGASLAAGHLDLRATLGAWSLALAADAARLLVSPATGPPRSSGLDLRSGTLSLEVERALSGPLSGWLRGTLGAAALALAGPAPPSVAWQQPGLRALQWPLRAAAAAGARTEGEAWSASLGVAAELPADPGAAAAGLELSVERRLARCTLALELAAGRLWPTGLWLGRAALEVRVAFGGAAG